MTTNAALADRLITGQRWLVATYEKLCALPHMGAGTPDEAAFYAQYDRWDAMAHIYAVYHECIYGAGKRCPEAALIDCVQCGDTHECPADD